MNGSLITSILLLGCMAMAANASGPAEACTSEKCQLPDCKCSTTDSGSGLPVENIPQMVMLSFDDAVTRQTADLFEEALVGLKNPDGCPIGVTHFLNHEYTDYERVNHLWLQGHEIALHSVTHENNMTYWSNMNVSMVESEFGDLRSIINHFALVPESDIHGIRSPFLQTAGDATIQGISNLGLLFDSSLPSLNYLNPALWPYTYDFATTQECSIPPCATAAFPGIWEVPMTIWIDQAGYYCSMVDACVNIPSDEEGILEWMLEQFERHYLGSRAPFPVFMHAAWFLRNAENFKAYKSFLNHLQSLPDVYIVGVSQAIQWIKNPAPISAEKPFGECLTRNPTSTCVAKSCGMKTATGEERWMTSCAKTCPVNYPALGNPYGV